MNFGLSDLHKNQLCFKKAVADAGVKKLFDGSGGGRPVLCLLIKNNLKSWKIKITFGLSL